VATNAEAHVVATPLAELTGEVTLAGQPVAEFTVRLSGPTVVGRPFADPGGRFRIEHLPAGAYVVVVEAVAGAGRADVAVSAEAQTVRIELEAYATLTGLAATSTGEPAVGEVVHVLPKDPNGPNPTRRRSPFDPSILTDAAGRFTVTGVAAGEGHVHVGTLDIFGAAPYVVAPGETRDVGVITVTSRGEREAKIFQHTSADLGVRFFVGPAAPSPAQLEAIDRQPRLACAKGDDARLWVASVTDGGAGASAGLLAGDRILAVGKLVVEARGACLTMIDLSGEWRSRGRSVVWAVERAGSRLEIPVALPE
jgi:hypothetical protein